MKQSLLALSLFVLFPACNSKHENGNTSEKKSDLPFSLCDDNCKTKSKSTDLSCKLTSQELQNRKATVLASLRNKTTGKKELKDGYAFKFAGNDKMLDEIVEFIKTERECCDFFTFNISVSGDKSEIWLAITGADGVKDFIKTELEL